MTQIDSTPIGAIRGGAVAAVDVRDLGKDFRRRRARGRGGPALAGVTLTVRRGECVAVLGQNGSGKSTLVRILSTLLLADGGTASVFGHDVVSDAKAVRRLVNRVSVEASFFKKLSAAENLHYAARFYGITARRTRERIPEILARVGFPPDRRGEPMENLSRGMQQKVALARALLTSPVLLLLDEPTTGLDPEARATMWEELERLAAQERLTILLTTHYLEEADRLAQRVAIVSRGRVVVEGAPEALKRALRGDAVTVELAHGDAARARALVADMPGVAETLADANRVHARVEHGAEAVPTILGLLDDAGVVVNAVTVSRPSLDDVYLHHTGRDFRSDDAGGTT